MKSDIEIAQECKLRPIGEIAALAGIPDEYIEQYGRYKAKVELDARPPLPSALRTRCAASAKTP